MNIDELEEGREYVIIHKKKGVCRGTLVEIRPAREGDEYDSVYLYFHFDTSPGSGQERLARAANATVTDANIRPSLLEDIRLSSRSPTYEEVEKEPEPEPEPTVGERLKRLFIR